MRSGGIIINTYLAIDLGTSNCRSAVFNDHMEMLSISDLAYPLINLSPTFVEQDADLWWQSVKDTIIRSLDSVDRSALRSISISSQGIALLPVDRYGNPLMNAISWLDMRAQDEEQEIEERYGLEWIFNLTGKRANACYTLSKLIWLKENTPEIYQQADKLMLPLDFIQYKLCGKAVTDHTMAGGTMYYDIHQQEWASQILDDYQIDRDKLPELSWSGKAIGTVTKEVAEDLGIPTDVIVTVGGQDQKCAALGAGISIDSAAVSLGTASCITQLADRPVLDREFRIPCFSYLWPDTWSFEGIINTAASSYQWFRNTLAPSHSYRQLDSLAAEASVNQSRAFFFPYLAGMTSPFWGNGMGSFTGLSLASDLGQLALAVMDGVICNVKANLDIMQAENRATREVRLFGGGSKSPFWCQIAADVLNLPVVTASSPETALVGAAMLAKMGYDGKRPGTPKAAHVYHPDSCNVEIYRDYYEDYLAQAEAML